MLHLMRVEEIKHLSCTGKVLWSARDINNLFHLNGQEFLLRIAFNGSGNITVPAHYYLGLDARPNPDTTDNLTNITGEPSQFGYARQAVSSGNGFEIAQDDNANFRATTDIITFSASGGTWGPVTNVFLGTVAHSTGFLLSTAIFDSPRTVNSGGAITMRVSVGLINC